MESESLGKQQKELWKRDPDSLGKVHDVDLYLVVTAASVYCVSSIVSGTQSSLPSHRGSTLISPLYR